MFTLRFAFKNIVSRKSSLVIILFIAFSICLLVVANAVFDGTGNGIEKTFSSSFTGDVVIRPKTDFPMSLFGDETPVTGELSELPRIAAYNNVIEYVKSQNEVLQTISQLTGQAVIRVDDCKESAVIFGVDAKNYINIMSAINVLEGEPYTQDQKGIMLNKTMCDKISSEIGTQLKVGDEVQLISSNGSSYSLRGCQISAIFDYSVHNDLQDNIILVDPETVRSLLGIESLSSAELQIDKKDSALIDAFDDIEDMFNVDDFFVESEGETQNNLETEIISENENSLLQNSTQELIDSTSTQTSWNYIICKLKPGENPDKFVKKLNKHFKKVELEALAISWRAAAGMSAQYIYWMRLIFNIGLILLIGTGFIVVNNTLVIAAIDRTKETGALRAIGANRKFIATEYLIETLMLTITAGILGCALGVFGNSLIINANITFSNSYLIQLFGGECLRTIVTFKNLSTGMILSLLLAIIGWAYPVHIALETSPVVAMEHI